MKRILLNTFTFTLIFILSMFFLGLNVNAYLDPSVTMYLIQVVVGVVVAIGAFVGIYYRRAKKKVSNALGIDENKNKEVESDEIIKK